MNTIPLTASLLTHSLAWALLYSLWQGLTVYGTLYVLLKALPNISARAKYYVSFGTLTALFLWFADTWVTEYQKLKGITVYITQPGTDVAASTTYAVKSISSAQLQSPLVHHLLPRIEHYFPLIILVYCIGLSFMLFRFLVNVVQLKALRAQGIIQPEAHWNDFILQWQEQFDITRPVRLFLSDRINVPMMLGAIKPVILLPIATMNHLSTEQVEAILLHELAHIRRHDYLLNIFQTIAETILFFNPFVWLVSAIIRREREHCCDDIVIGCDASPLLYARALATLEDNRVHSNSLTLAATGNKSQLFHRIKRIMEMKKSNFNYAQLTIVIVAIIAVTFTVAMFTFTPSFAQKVKSDKNDTSDTTTQTKKVYKYKSVTIDSNGKRTETVKESNKPIKDKMKGEDQDEDDVNVNVSVKDDKDDKNAAPKAYSYSYSYSDKDGEELAKAIKEITIAATQTAADAVANIDFKEIEKELEDAKKEINDVDWNAIKKEIRESLKEVDKELDDAKMDKEVSIEVKRGLEKSREALEQAEKELRTVKQVRVTSDAPPAPPAPLAAPTPPAPPAPPAENNYESMLNKMEKDGLIDRSKKYSIEKENGELYINGEKQPDDIYRKYHRYLKDKSVSIKGHKGSMNISTDN